MFLKRNKIGAQLGLLWDFQFLILVCILLLFYRFVLPFRGKKSFLFLFLSQSVSNSPHSLSPPRSLSLSSVSLLSPPPPVTKKKTTLPHSEMELCSLHNAETVSIQSHHDVYFLPKPAYLSRSAKRTRIAGIVSFCSHSTYRLELRQ